MRFAMHDAAEDGDLERVRQLIEAGVPVDSLNEEGQTPLHRAAFYGQYEVAGLLIDNKCDLDIKDHLGRTPMISAAFFYYKYCIFQKKGDILDLLLRRGARVNCVDNDGSTLLHHACNTGWTEIVRLILNYGEADLNAFDQTGSTPLMLALKKGHKEIVRLILDFGEADLNASDQTGSTPLMLAVVKGYEEIAALLIRAGADVNRSGVMKRTALHWAAQGGQTRVIQILLQKEGLDLSPQDLNGITPLDLAYSKFHDVAIKQLLYAGAGTNIMSNQGRSALRKVTILSELTIEEIRLIVQKGAFMEERDYEFISQNPFLKKEILKDVEFCTQSIVNKFHHQSLPALKNITYSTRRLPNVDNFKLKARHIDEVKNLVKCEIERNTFCNVVKVHPIALSALCVLSLITCKSGNKRAASPDFGLSPFKKVNF